MNSRFLIVIAFIIPLLGFSQGEFNNWYFGNKAGVTFNSGSPVTFLSNTLSAETGGTYNISDSLGNILFYGYGPAVLNRNNTVMPNGIIGGFMCFGDYDKVNIAFQWIGNKNKYYLFSGGCYQIPYNTGLKYSVIDMTLNGGLGDVPIGMNGVYIPSASRAYTAVTGTRHHNNMDVWVVTRLRDTDSNYYSSYEITSTGINFNPVLSNSLLQLYTPPAASSVTQNIKISRDGTKLVTVYNSILEYCNFNSTTGQVTPSFLFRLPMCGDHHISPSCAEFSIDTKFLYVSGSGTGTCPAPVRFLYQFDATQTDSAQFVNSAIMINNQIFSPGLQLAPDQKIYCTQGMIIDSLSVINNPSSPGIGCNYQRDVLSLMGRQSGYSLPDYIERYYALIHDTDQCQQQLVHFTSNIWPLADSIHWNFGDPTSGPYNFSNLQNPTHVYSIAGTYTVELFVRHIDNRTDTTWQTINIISSPQVSLGAGRTICTGDSTTFDAGVCIGCTFLWKDLGSGFTVGTAQTFRTGQVGTYAIFVTNSNNCIGSDTVQLTTTPVPLVTNNPLFKSICSGESTNIPLTSNVAGTLFHWTATLASGNITDFSADSGLVINQTLVNHLATPGVVTYHVTPKVGSCAGSTVDFAVTVNQGDSVKVSITPSVNNVCAGTSVTFTATPTNPGSTPLYQWKVNGVTAGTNSQTFIYTPVNGDQVNCILTSSLTVCISNNPATSNTITMVVNPNLPVSVSVSPSANPVCAGTSVTFTATPTHGGITPVYLWKVNGTVVGSNNPTYAYIPLNNDVITCTLTSSETCTTGNPAISNQITMTVNPNLPVIISISASSNPFCIGGSVTFTATPTHGGITPSYQWKVNGLNVGFNNPIYTYNPISGDNVTCILISSDLCVTGNPATSNTINMIGNLGLPAGVIVNASPNPFCPGTTVTFTAIPTNGGGNPSYQWKVNGANAGTNSTSFTYNPGTGDKVTCLMTSILECVSGNPALSNEIILSGTSAPIVTFTLCFDSITTINAKSIKLRGGIPLGGTYSGPGVSVNIFNPANAGVGTKTITYSYTNAALCSASKTKTIIVQVVPAFSCGNNLTDIRDGKSYPTVQIGSQCWMATNLNYGIRVPSTEHQRDNCINEKYCYNDLDANCEQRGASYQWDEIMRYDDTPAQQGLCPPAWHVPTEAEWNILFAFYTNNGFAGSPLKYSGFSGFNALLNGVNHFNRQWDFNDFATFFWSSTPYGPYKAWSHGMNDYNPSVSFYPSSRANAFSVRCLKDN